MPPRPGRRGPVGAPTAEATMSTLPRLIVTGASGFLGRRVLEALAGRWRIYAIDRRSQEESGAPDRPGVSWHHLDVAEAEPVTRLFEEIRQAGGAQALLHLAAYYDFTGDPHPEYERTNVHGTEVVLEAAQRLELERFFFASSVAACDFPPPGAALDESSPPDGSHLYALTKRFGETRMRAVAGRMPTAILRFAALFSDWCEYAPLFQFLDTWLSRRWNRSVLGGRGNSAIPYLHVRDLLVFLERALDLRRDLAPAEVLIASPDGAVSHRELFHAATRHAFGRARRPVLVPAPLARVGIELRDRLGRMTGRRPFERPWMGRYIDLRLAVDASRTRRRLGWSPRPRLEVLRRLPFLVENLRGNPAHWYELNRASMHGGPLAPQLQLLRLIERHQEEIRATFTRALVERPPGERLPHYADLPAADHAWHHRQLMRSLLTAIRSGERGTFMAFCRDLAERRARQGVPLGALREALTTFERVCRRIVLADPDAAGLESWVRERLTVTLEFGVDAVEEVYERLLGIVATGADRAPAPTRPAPPVSPPHLSGR